MDEIVAENQIIESKKERFKRIAEKRTKNILRLIRILGNCANRAVYDYSEDEIEKIFNAINEELKISRAKFREDKQIDFKL